MKSAHNLAFSFCLLPPASCLLLITRTPFIVADRVRADQIEILAVIHAARRWADNF